MAVASDDAIDEFRSTPSFFSVVKMYSSYTQKERLRRQWVRYPFELSKRVVHHALGRKKVQYSRTPFLDAASISSGTMGQIQATSNQLLAALGHNEWVPKVPGQKGLRILSLDGGGSRGVVSISMMRSLVDAMGGLEVCDAFDIICGTSTGAIIAFLVGLRRESSADAKKKYDELVEKIFIKSALSKPMLVLTTATYSEIPFKVIMEDILENNTMLDTRADPRVPLVFAVSSKMSTTTTSLALFRNYNYCGGERFDNFVVPPEMARKRLNVDQVKLEKSISRTQTCTTVGSGSRHDGSFRILQRAALRASTAAPTVFKPVKMCGEMYSDGGLVASNPSAIAIHEARTLFPDVPIEAVVSLGTGRFVSKKVSPSFGWDGIIDQIVKSATDTAKTHHVLEDILGQGHTVKGGSSVSHTKYYRVSNINQILLMSVDYLKFMTFFSLNQPLECQMITQ